MEEFQIRLDNDLWEDFKSIQQNQEIFNNYCNYFSSLVNWLKEHLYILNSELIFEYRLDNILDIDVRDYFSPNPEIELIQEKKRMFSHKPDTVDSLIMRISNTLWDIIKQRSGKDCPRCKDDELNYVIAEVQKTKEKKLILECDTCGWAENLDNTKWTQGSAIIHPISNSELKKLI